MCLPNNRREQRATCRGRPPCLPIKPAPAQQPYETKGNHRGLPLQLSSFHLFRGEMPTINPQDHPDRLRLPPLRRRGINRHPPKRWQITENYSLFKLNKKKRKKITVCHEPSARNTYYFDSSSCRNHHHRRSSRSRHCYY